MTLRKVWFITRPERDPRFHQEALIALVLATDSFTVKWAGNREVHKAYEQALCEAKIKRENVSADGSGGRTWAAMLKTFSYCYLDQDGFIIPTKVGIALINGQKVFDNIKKQILTLQIPNAYFLEPGFRPKFEDGFSIRPARFLTRLANQALLDFYLTKEEITFFVLTAKRDDQLEEVANSIKRFRESSREHQQAIKLEIAEKYDHRMRLDHSARSYENAYSDVAHTFMLICDYTGMTKYVRGKALHGMPKQHSYVLSELDMFDQRFPFNKRYMLSLQRMAENNGLDVDSFKGRSIARSPVASNREKIMAKTKRLLERFPDLGQVSIGELEEVIGQEFPPHEAKIIAEQLQEDVGTYSSLNSDFVESYLNEEDNQAFEDKTGEIFKAIGFDVTMRPSPCNGENTEIEILLSFDDEKCGIVDAKNYKINFPLSASLASHMASEYVPNYQGFEGKRITFFGYVTASDFSGERNLEKISRKVREHSGINVCGFMLNARTLLAFMDYCLDNGYSKSQMVNMFLRSIRNKGFRSIGAMFDEIDKEGH